jgi:predicted metal-dependent phosphoesterase TrpH
MKLDLHCHSSHSPDGKVKVEEFLLHAKKAGFGGLAITDHNEIEGSLKAFKIAKEYGLIAVRGVEISSHDGHMLAYGISEPVPRGLGCAETLERIESLGGIGIAAHPYRWYTGLKKRVIVPNKFAAYEARNGRSLTSTNNKVERLAAKMGKGITAGSDCHDLTEFGSAHTVFEDNIENEDELIAAIIKRRTRLGGHGRPLSSSIRYASFCLKEWMGRGMKRI